MTERCEAKGPCQNDMTKGPPLIEVKILCDIKALMKGGILGDERRDVTIIRVEKISERAKGFGLA